MYNYATRIAWSKKIDNQQKPPSPVQVKEYEIWSEGYAATGEHGTATFHGKSKGRSFKEACIRLMCEEHIKWIDKMCDPDYIGQRDNPDYGWSYDANRNTLWGCNMYDNEVDARKSFG